MIDSVNIMEIERFALHDGPGIRTTVFLKGCPLKCPWCANPESRTADKLLMHFISKCVRCGRCAAACENGAVVMVDGAPVFDRESCVLCGRCKRACLNDAIDYSGRLVSVDEIIAEVERDRAYYDRTDGGMTVSGGEPFMQFDALCALLTAAREKGISTAVETSAQTPTDRFSTVSQLADMMLVDIKHTDADLLREVTGADFSLLRANIEAAIGKRTRVIGRVPVIPGFNADSLEGILDFAAEVGIGECHLLTYHTLGVSKYTQIGKKYTWSTAALDKSSLARAAEYGGRLGLKIKIGG